MKLRIKGDSLRLRVAPSEVVRLLEAGRIEETIHFGPGADDALTYAVEHVAQAGPVSVRYAPREIAVVVSRADIRAWSDGDEIGIYGELNTGAGALEIAVEKDFACLDKNDAENADTFPNPNQGTVC